MAVTTLPRPYNLFAGRFRPPPGILTQVHHFNAPTASAGPPRCLPSTLSFGVSLSPVDLTPGSPVCGTGMVKERRPASGAINIGGRSTPPVITGRRLSAPIITGQRI